MKKTLLLISLLLCISNVIFAQLVDIPITIADGSGGTQIIRFGLDPAATDGIDASLGETSLPPLPPTGIFDARFNLPNSTESSLKDYRQGSSSLNGQRIHEIQYQVGTGTSITISWNLPTGVAGRLQDVIVGSLIDVPMSGSGSYQVTNPGAFNKLKLTATYTPVLTTPAAPALFSPSNQVANVSVIGVLFQWRKAQETLESILKYQFQLSPDSLFGGIFINESSLTDTNYYLIDSINHQTKYFWRVRAQNLMGWGNWSEIWNFTTLSLGSLVVVDIPITIADGSGGTQIIRFGLDPVATDGIDVSLGETSLPPLPPTGIFDARFNLPNSTESSLKDYRQGSSLLNGERIHEIQYQVGTGTSITISWNLPTGVAGRLQDIITGTLIDIQMTGSGSYQVTNPGAFNKLKLTATYTLGQNAPVYSTLWQKSAAQGSLPAWFGSNTERGFAFGKVNDGSNFMVDRLFVVSRSSGNAVKVVNPGTGEDAGSLTMDPIITGGLIAINDVEVTYDGKILASNVVGSTVTAQDWKVYMWDNLTSTPVLAMTYVVPPVTPNTRLGDKFRVTGNFYNNTAIIWAADAANAKVYKFSMSGGAFNPVPEVITLSNNAFGGSASVGPLPDGSFYYNAAGKNVMKYSATGMIIDTIPGTVVATGSNAIQYLGSINRTVNEYILTFAYGAGNENGFMATIPDGDPNFATFYGKTPTLGVNANANGTGDVAYMFNNDGTLTVFTLSSNNGLGAYKLLNAVPVELASFNATANVNNVNVDWVTSTETNSADFIIERKSSNGNWQSAGSVKAAGTSTSSRAYSFIDKNVATGKYSYRLKQIDFDGSTTIFNAIEVEVGVPAVFDLSQNYPNPFNPSTTIRYSIPEKVSVSLVIYDQTGRTVEVLVSGEQNPGRYSVKWNAEKYASGVYFYELKAGQSKLTNKMILLK